MRPEILLTDDILDRISSNLIGRLYGKPIEPNLLFEIKTVIRNAFLDQASIRGLDPHGLGEIVNKIKITVDQSNIVIDANEDIRNEIDMYLGNKQCRICGMKIPYSHDHSHDECDTELVNRVMVE